MGTDWIRVGPWRGGYRLSLPASVTSPSTPRRCGRLVGPAARLRGLAIKRCPAPSSWAWAIGERTTTRAAVPPWCGPPCPFTPATRRGPRHRTRWPSPAIGLIRSECAGLEWRPSGLSGLVLLDTLGARAIRLEAYKPMRAVAHMPDPIPVDIAVGVTVAGPTPFSSSVVTTIPSSLSAAKEIESRLADAAPKARSLQISSLQYPAWEGCDMCFDRHG